jgi:hypothetical protein
MPLALIFKDNFIRLAEKKKTKILLVITYLVSRAQMKSWAGKALETVNCCTFLKRRLIGAFDS